MKAPVTHINLLQRTAPAHAIAWALVALVALTMVGMLAYGSRVRGLELKAAQRRDDLAQQVKQLQARMAALSGEQAKNADALAMRKEVDALQPHAQAAQAMIDAVRTAQGARSGEFARTLGAMTRMNEPSLWLTGLVVSDGGKKLELRGEARSGASVLRFARRVNESLQPLALRLDVLEMQPAAAASAAAGTVSFHLH